MSKQNNFFNLYLKVNDKEAKTTLNNVGKDLRTLRSYTKNLEEGTEKWHAANKKLAEVEKTYDGMKKKQREFINQTKEATDETSENHKAMQVFGEAASDTFAALASGDLIGVQNGLKAMRAGIMGATKAAWAFIATPIGATLAAFAGIALITKEWSDYNKEAAEANLVTQQITRLSGEALDQARVRATAIEKTYGTDFKRSLESASTLVEAFGISYEEAFDRIEDGLIRGGKENDEFLDSVREYPKLFAQAGFSAEDFQRIVNTGIDLKIYSDKLPDAVKEFSLAIMEETQPARDALENAFGKKFTDELFENIQNGSMTSKDALQLISAEAETIGLNAQQAQQLTADLFKGAGEDAGGALVVFEAVNIALSEQTRELTPLEANLKKVADANRNLEEAQNDALKSDQYAAFMNNIEVAWINFKAGFFRGINSVMEGLVSADTAFRKFVFQSVQYVKDAFTIGADADWEKLGKQFDEQQAKIEEAARQQRELEKKNQEKTDGTDGTSEKDKEAARKKREAEEKAAAEAAKTREERAKKALEAEKKRLEELNKLEAEYSKKKEDRLANSAVKEAELDMQRALKKAEALGAEQELLDQIRAEWKVKIDEEQAKEEEEELQRMRDFEDKKLELENELRLARAESDAEREAIQKDIDLEKEQAEYEKKMAQFEEEMARLELTEEEKNQVLASLKEAHENVILGIQKKYTDEKIKDEERLNAAKKKLWNDSLDAAINLAGSETKVGQALLIAKQIMAAKEMAVELGLFQSKISLKTAEATGDIAAGQAKTAAAAPFPANIPLILGFAAQVGGIVSAIKGALQAKSKVKKSYAKGGDTTLFGMGYRDETGEEVAGIVHTGEYVIPKFVRQDPEVPQIIDYLEAKRRKKLGSFADGGDTDAPGNDAGSIPSSGTAAADFIEAARMLINRFDRGIEAYILYGPEAELKRQAVQKKLDKIKNASQIKKQN